MIYTELKSKNTWPRGGMPWRCLCGVLLVFLWVTVPHAALAEERGTWIVVDTGQRTLTVFAGAGDVVMQFSYVALGRGGVARDRVHGDRKTPLGTFHVAWVNPDSRFTLFFGLDFPTVPHADRAYREHVIDRETYHRILDAALEQHIPPQDTPLGGQIGIHGLGDKDRRFHYTDNWTDGCVALTNEEIKALAQWVKIGTKVIIL